MIIDNRTKTVPRHLKKKMFLNNIHIKTVVIVMLNICSLRQYCVYFVF